MRRTNRRGFTIVELLMVVAVIAVLATIVTSAASGAIRQARGRRAEASRTILEAGLAAYHMDQEKWPGSIENEMEDPGNANEGDVRCLSYADSCEALQTLAKESLKGAAKGKSYLDLSDLLVCNQSSGLKPQAHGLPFREAARANSTRALQVSSSKMNVAFGYQDSQRGYFRPFYVALNVKTERVFVTTCCPTCFGGGSCNNSKCPHCHDMR